MEEKFKNLKMDDTAKISEDFPFVQGITDVAFKAEDTIFFINKGILMVASPVIHKMLTSDFNENKDGVVNLPDKRAEDVSLFLKCLYPCHHIVLTDRIVDSVLPLASEYMVESLVERCDVYSFEKYFTKPAPRTPTLDDLLKFVYHGIEYNAKRIQEQAMLKLPKWKSSKIREHEIYKRFPSDIKERILIARVTELESRLSTVPEKINAFFDADITCRCGRGHKYKVSDNIFTKSLYCDRPIELNTDARSLQFDLRKLCSSEGDP